MNLVRGKVHDALVTGHAIRLEQALVNLLDNAVKFNKPGGEVRIDAAPAPDGRIRHFGRRTGSGIPSADVPREFSSASIAWTGRARAKSAAPVSGFPS